MQTLMKEKLINDKANFDESDFFLNKLLEIEMGLLIVGQATMS